MESKVTNNTLSCRALSVSLQSNCVAIAQLLQQKIGAAISLSSLGKPLAALSDGVELTLEAIPLHRLPNEACIIYRSAIALKLASILQLPALDVADQLMASLPLTREQIWVQEDLEAVKTLQVEPLQLPLVRGEQDSRLNFLVEMVCPGWIDFRLDDRGLAAWLQKLIQIPLISKLSDSSLVQLTGSHDFSTVTQNYFPLQYAHARCCSLLRLAHREGLITLQDMDFKTHGGRLVIPNPIPWLQNQQEMDTGQGILRLVHPAERSLIAQLLDVCDAISKPSKPSPVKLANALSKAFEEFYRNCRIWGEVKTQTPELAQARLGLVGVTQGMLRSLLEDDLGIPAPIEL